MDRSQNSPNQPSSAGHPLDDVPQDETSSEVKVLVEDGRRIVVDTKPSYAEQLKSSWWTRTSSHRMGGRQFGIAGMLGLMTAAAVVLSFAKSLGFELFFVLLLNLCIVFAPFVVFLILISCPGISRKNRKWIAIGLGLLAFLPGVVMIAVSFPWQTRVAMLGVSGSYRGPTAGLVLVGYSISMLCTWLPQILWLWILFDWKPIRRVSPPAEADDYRETHISPKPTRGGPWDSPQGSPDDG